MSSDDETHDAVKLLSDGWSPLKPYNKPIQNQSFSLSYLHPCNLAPSPLESLHTTVLESPR